MAQIQFKGKTFVQNHHLLVKYHELVPVKAKSLTDKVTLHDNLIIHGDNLKALKALLPLYAGKVKCVYIDPPYNTGNEGWAYNDNVSSPMMQDWLGKVVDREDLTRHDKWLCMMMPRLKLIRELMTKDGVIFVSIDDNEVHRLRMSMEEIFGEENFIAVLPTITNLKGNQDEFGFAGTHEYVLVFAYNKEATKLGEFELDDEELEKWEEDEIGFFKQGANLKSTGVNAPREKRPNLYFPIYVSHAAEISIDRMSKSDIELLPITDKKKMSWRWSKGKISREAHNLIVVRDGDNVNLYKKQRPSLGDLPSRKPKSVFYRPEYSSGNGTGQMKTIFGKKVFNNPKPTELIQDLVSLGSDKNAIVFDSFAGSGTTAHAVLALNKEDGGNRRFILVECEDYADTITAERIRRVIKGVPSAKDETLKKGLGGTFSFFKLGKPLELESILDGDSMPTYEELARYVFYTATGEEFDPAFAKASPCAKPLRRDKSAGRDKADDKYKNFIGESRNYQVFLFYEPDVEKLKNLALTLDMVKNLPAMKKDKRRLVFAPTKYLDQEHLDQFRIDFAQLPFEIYELTR